MRGWAKRLGVSEFRTTISPRADHEPPDSFCFFSLSLALTFGAVFAHDGVGVVFDIMVNQPTTTEDDFADFPDDIT